MATKFSKEEVEAMRSMSPEQRKAFVDAKATENKTTTNQDARRDRIAEFKMRQEMLQNIPRGAKSSAPGNPYSVAVADPFGAIAGGVMNYQEMKAMNKDKAERGVDAVNAENAAATIGTAMSESAANYEPPADWVNVGKGVMQNTVTGEERVSKAYQSEAEKDRAGKLADALAKQGLAQEKINVPQEVAIGAVGDYTETLEGLGDDPAGGWRDAVVAGANKVGGEAVGNMAETSLFSDKAQGARAQGATVDARISEASQKGVLSDSDRQRLASMNVNAPGLSNADKLTRARQIDEILRQAYARSGGGQGQRPPTTRQRAESYIK